MATAQESLDFVDELYFSALYGEEAQEMAQDQPPEEGEEFQVSDEKYAGELQFQEALMGSVIVSQMNKNNIASSSLMIVETTPISVFENPSGSTQIVKSGESSSSYCEICDERKGFEEMFKIEGCVHSFCCDCISKHVSSRIGSSTSTVVTCLMPKCRAVLELDACRPILGRAVIDIWEEALCEEVIRGIQRFYCPFKDCSALLLVDDGGEGGGGGGGGGEVITQSECPFCHRLFCAQCYVPWHPGIVCAEFQRLNEDEREREDLLLRELAQNQKWGRCPQCKYYVERTEGCPHMTCRCKFQFCYGCGEAWDETHGGCQRN